MLGRMLKRSLSSLILLISLLALSLLAGSNSANSLAADALTANSSPLAVNSLIAKPSSARSSSDKPSPLIDKATDQDIISIGRPNFRVFNDKQGLPQNTINCLLQDAQSNIWIGTQDGAAYFNGRVWTTVNMPNRDESNNVHRMLIAHDKSIWFGTETSVQRLQDGKWQRFDTSKGLPQSRVNVIFEASDGKIWAGTRKGLARLDGDRFTLFTTESGLPADSISCIIEKKIGNRSVLWIGTRKGLVQFDNGRFEVLPVFEPLSKKPISAMAESIESNGEAKGEIKGEANDETKGRHRLWITTTESGLYYIDDDATLHDQSQDLPNKNLNCILIDQHAPGDYQLWLGSDAGLISFNRGKWQLFDNNYGIPNNLIWSLLQTFSGGMKVLWIGTSGAGLVQYIPGKWQTIDTRAGLPTNGIWRIKEGRLNGSAQYFVGTDGGGLAYWQNGQWVIKNEQTGFPSNSVRTVLETIEDGELCYWIGGVGGLARLRPRTGETKFWNKDQGLPSNLVIALHEDIDSAGKPLLWVGTINGLATYQQGKVTAYEGNEPLKSTRIWDFLEVKEPNGARNLWVATDQGLFILSIPANQDYTKGTWRHIGRAEGLPANIVMSLALINWQGKTVLAAGSKGNGLLITDPLAQDPKWQTISSTTKLALPNNDIYDILQDKNGKIYLLTNKGVARITRQTPTANNADLFKVYTYTTDDGLPSNECNQGAGLIDSKNRIWIGTAAGLAFLDLNNEVEADKPEKLQIDRWLVADKELSPTLSGAAPIKLNYDQNHLVFEFALASFFRGEDTRYATQLVGFEDKVSDWQPDYKREYSNLADGNYIFRVIARDYAGNISDPVEIAFTIKAAPWRTWWAYLLYIGLAMGTLYFGVQYRLQTLAQRNQLLETRVTERTAQLDHKNHELAQTVEQLKISQKETEQKNEELARKNEELIRSKEELVASHKRTDLIFSALSDVLQGSIIEDKYRLDSKIGSGGFGAVYRSTHLVLNREVAVKIFRPTAANATHEALERFRLEGISACRVNHPNAVAILDSGITSNGIAYLVMELLQGRSLAEELKEHNRLSPRRCGEVLLPICDVLAKAHSAGIIHRDIKPDNIFLHQVEGKEVIKVVDFGIAKLLGESSAQDAESLTVTGGFLGTPAYMAPERLESKPYDGRADVYSVGIMLYRMLCGKPPFLSLDGSIWTLISRQLTEPPLAPSRLNNNISVELERVILHALEKDAQQRPSAKDLADELREVLALPSSDWQSAESYISDQEDQITQRQHGHLNPRTTVHSVINKTADKTDKSTDEITLIQQKESVLTNGETPES